MTATHASASCPVVPPYAALALPLAELAGGRRAARRRAGRAALLAAQAAARLAAIFRGGLRRRRPPAAPHARQRRALSPVGAAGGHLARAGRWRAAARGPLVSLAPRLQPVRAGARCVGDLREPWQSPGRLDRHHAAGAPAVAPQYAHAAGQAAAGGARAATGAVLFQEADPRGLPQLRALRTQRRRRGRRQRDLLRQARGGAQPARSAHAGRDPAGSLPPADARRDPPAQGLTSPLQHLRQRHRGAGAKANRPSNGRMGS